MTNTYTTGTGQTLYGVHEKDSCYSDHCPIHNPSDHPMKDFPTHWRDDRMLMERICPHGVGHPDPDHLAGILTFLPTDTVHAEMVHGCDGCCGDSYVNLFLDD